MIEWFKELSNKSWYLWFEVVDPFASISEVVYVAKLSDYKLENQMNLGKREKHGSYLYKSKDGEDLVICWGLQLPSFCKDVPVPDAWCVSSIFHIKKEYDNASTTKIRRHDQFLA